MVQPGDVEAELKRIGHTLKPLEIVVVNTRAGSRYGEEDYIDAGCGMGKAATLWMLERGIRLVGTDGWSLGRAVQPHQAAGAGDRRCRADLGRPPRRAGDRLFPPGEAQQPGGVAGGRVPGGLLPGEGASRLGRLDHGRWRSSRIEAGRIGSASGTSRWGARHRGPPGRTRIWAYTSVSRPGRTGGGAPAWPPAARARSVSSSRSSPAWSRLNSAVRTEVVTSWPRSVSTSCMRRREVGWRLRSTIAFGGQLHEHDRGGGEADAEIGGDFGKRGARRDQEVVEDAELRRRQPAIGHGAHRFGGHDAVCRHHHGEQGGGQVLPRRGILQRGAGGQDLDGWRDRSCALDIRELHGPSNIKACARICKRNETLAGSVSETQFVAADGVVGPPNGEFDARKVPSNVTYLRHKWLKSATSAGGCGDFGTYAILSAKA